MIKTMKNPYAKYLKIDANLYPQLATNDIKVEKWKNLDQEQPLYLVTYNDPKLHFKKWFNSLEQANWEVATWKDQLNQPLVEIKVSNYKDYIPFEIPKIKAGALWFEAKQIENAINNCYWPALHRFNDYFYLPESESSGLKVFATTSLDDKTFKKLKTPITTLIWLGTKSEAQSGINQQVLKIAAYLNFETKWKQIIASWIKVLDPDLQKILQKIKTQSNFVVKDYYFDQVELDWYYQEQLVTTYTHHFTYQFDFEADTTLYGKAAWKPTLLNDKIWKQIIEANLLMLATKIKIIENTQQFALHKLN